MFKKLSTNNFFILTITAFVSTLSIASLWLTDTYVGSEKEIKNLRQHDIHFQKVLLRERVHFVAMGLKHRSALAETMARWEDRMRVETDTSKRIRTMRFGKDGRIFIFDKNGTVVLHPTKPELEGKNLLQKNDANGTLCIAALLRMVQEKKRGFASCMWPQPDSGRMAEKLVYAESIEGTDRIVCSSISMEAVHRAIREKEAFLNEKMQKKMVEFVTLFFLLLLVIFFFLYRQYVRLNNSFKQFHSVLSESHKTLKLIDIDKIDFEEFQTLAKNFNAMIRLVHNTINHLDQTVKQKTEALREQKEIFESLFQKSTDAILLLEEGRFIDCNESALKLFGYASRDAIIALRPFRLSREHQPEGENTLLKAERMMQQAMDEGFHAFEWMCVRATGEAFWAEVVLTKIVQNNRDILHAVVRDISDRKATEAQLKQLTQTLQERVEEEVEKNRQKDQAMLQQTKLAQMGEMISMIAHQWRQPLAAVSATSGDLAMKIMLDNCDKEYFSGKLEKIESLSLYLSKTIDDFRNFYKQDKASVEVLLSEIVDNALGIVSVSAANKNIQVTTDYQCQCTIRTYPNELRQVILNLIKNAEDVLAEGGTASPKIVLKTYDKGDYAYLEVSDNGGGIDVEIMDKIFEPYFSTKLQKDGTGLGLYMSKIIVEEHCGGRLTVSNTDEGALFRIALPFAESGDGDRRTDEEA